MGTNIGEEVKYHCFNDCQQSGCPGHTMRMDVSRTSDVIVFLVDGEPEYYFDENQWEAMQKAEIAHAEKNGWDLEKFKERMSALLRGEM